MISGGSSTSWAPSAADRTYDDLIDGTVALRIGENTHRMIDLATLIETKREARRPKDMTQLPLLEATLLVEGEDEYE